jgi:hypothetical protein
MAGRTGRCPGCKMVVHVPRPDLISLEKPPAPPEDPDHDHRLSQFAYTHSGVSRFGEPAAEKPQRKYPAVLDVFLYPFSISGIANLCIFWLLPLLAYLIPPAGLLALAPALVQLIVTAYMYYYLMDCIRDSAAGGIRAPENIGSQPGASAAFAVAKEVAASFVVFWGPLSAWLLYALWLNLGPEKQHIDPVASPIFWVALAYGVTFFPIGVLAIAMMDFNEAVKPWVWLRAIALAPFPYCGLVLGCLAMAGLLFLTGLLAAAVPLLGFLVRGIDVCLLMTLSHLIGRFYCSNADKIAWEV